MIMEESTIIATADEIIGLYEKFGAEDYIGEPVSQIEHMCQCARLAEKEGYDEDVVLAALFHDIGHFCEHIMPVESMDGLGAIDHEKLGADYLAQKGFSARICRLVTSHVDAKRYLTCKYPEYYEQLSEASRKTLVMQGGIMGEEEAIAFENDELFGLYIKLRQWDEQAKEVGIPLPPMEKFRSMIIRNLKNNIQ